MHLVTVLVVLATLCTDVELTLRWKPPPPPLRGSPSSAAAARRCSTLSASFCFCFWRVVAAAFTTTVPDALALPDVAAAAAALVDRVLAVVALPAELEGVSLRTLAADAAVGFALRQQFSLPSNGVIADADADADCAVCGTGGATGGSWLAPRPPMRALLLNAVPGPPAIERRVRRVSVLCG